MKKSVRVIKVRSHQALVRVRHDWAQTMGGQTINRAVSIEDSFDGRGFIVTNEDGQQVVFRIHENW